MSPWSSPHRILLLLLAVGMAVTAPGGAQDAAILRAGPDRMRGIPYLRANALEGFRGSYAVGPKDFRLTSGPAPPADRSGPDGSSTAGPGDPEQLPEPEVVEVFYTRVPLVFPQEWVPVRCGTLRLLEVVGGEDFTLCYRDEQGWTLFFQFPRPGAELPLLPLAVADRPAGASGPFLPAALPGPTGEQPPWACPFAERFVRRFQILLGFMDASREPPFPAVLELRR